MLSIFIMFAQLLMLLAIQQYSTITLYHLLHAKGLWRWHSRELCAWI